MPTLVPSSDDVRIYEISVMYPANLDQKSENALLKEIDDLFSEASAKVIFKDPWSKRGLAYPIKGHTEAKYVIFYAEMDPARVRELDHDLRLLKGVLRHLMLIPPKGYEAQSFESFYETWLKSRESAEDVRRRKTEEKAKETVVANAKRATKRMETKKKPVESVEMDQLSTKLDALISDDDLKI
ncbi:MAG: 30S ribosomal protein S6 [Candidatus Peribacteraceae bacterium]